MIFSADKQKQRLKWSFENCKNGTWGEEPDGEHDVDCIRAADFDGKLGTLADGERTKRAVDPDTYTKTKLSKGDVIIEKSGGGEKQLVGRAVLYLSEEKAVCSNFLARCKPAENMDSKFINYLLLAIYVARGTYPHIKQSTGIQNLDLSSFLDTKVDIPPLKTQKHIAQFLDQKTAQIDGLIEKKRALLERLAEKRQALITQAVTKGLNPNAPMKPSGIEWLGDIPAHWEVLPVKRIAKLESGHTPDKKIDAYWEDCEIPWVSLNDTAVLRASDYISDTTYKINKLGLANSSARMLPARAVVFTRDATIGESAITTKPMAVSQHIIAWLCDEGRVIPEFLLFAIYGMKGELLRLTNGSTIGTIGLGDVKSIRIALPPISEQEAVISAIVNGKTRIDRVSDTINLSLQQLLEYRSALITSAITGQLKLA